ncbi:hypothetical protein MKX50_13660 [Paenibacillus sp. FSL W8-0186]|uniref:Methyltransferase n=1 Tax=Paenibacillus woosongensis TaxID=307580 RepID=A0ABQ4MTW0_9BACL|nr:hypothetical protein [Paenibacillus woosongensis]GIP59370.1 hypothetical protein J15TS10_31840 [Paenibacillus woosongensis]
MASFDRKVERNQMKLNKKGKNPQGNKAGRTGTGSRMGARGDGDVFKGRKIILPLLLILLAGLYAGVALAGGSAEVSTTMFWLTIVLYVILAIALFLNKPYLRINKNYLFTAKLNRDRMLEAGQISKITATPNKITITPKAGGQNWVFYRKRNLFDTPAMAERLETFAKTHKVDFVKE